MDCPKFTPNIFYPSKCRQCFKCREDHQIQNQDVSGIVASSVSTVPSGDILKCGHLFIAPVDYVPQDPHSRNKRWQRRWFILFQQGQQGLISYALDDHPEAVPQGKIDLSLVEELRSGEEVTGHDYSFILKSPQSSVFLKGSSVDEFRKWITLLSKYVPNSLDLLTNGRLSIRRSSSSASTVSNATLDEFRPPLSPPKPSSTEVSPTKPKPSISVLGKVQPLVKLRSYNPSYEPTKPKSQSEVTPRVISNEGSKTSPSLRGDPDGDEQLVTIDGVHGLTSPGLSKWTTKNSPTPPVASVRSKLETLKVQLASRKWDLEKIGNKTDTAVLKSDRVLVDTLKFQLNSYFLEIDKLSYSLNVQEGELRNALKTKDTQLAELEAEVTSLQALPLKNNLLTEENRLLVTRINDLTEKFYNMEKSSKVLKTKLHRYRTNSLKDKDLEQEVTSKVTQLESRLNLFLSIPTETPPQSPCPLPPSSGTPTLSTEKKSLVGVILKLNELEQRLDAPQAFNPGAEWYKCGNCEFLQEEIQQRDTKLSELETMVNTLEATLDHAQSIRTKYETEVAEVQSLCADSLRQLEAAYNRLVTEIEEKHRIEMISFEITKDQELEDEIRATKETLELLKRTYEAELANGVAEARQNLRRKYTERGTALQDLHHRHEEETEELRQKLNQLTLKYSEKCIECGQLQQEALIRRNPT